MFEVISAFILAVEMIRTHCKKLKYIRRIVIITNGSGTIDEDDNAEIVKQVNQDNIEVTIM
jgi:ATP-dependent DNA helicase 2 subunit 2